MSGLGGQATDIDIHAKDIMRLRERLNTILANHTGQPIEKMIDTLPAGVSDRLQGVVRATVTRLLGMALKTMDARPRRASPRTTRRG